MNSLKLVLLTAVIALAITFTFNSCANPYKLPPGAAYPTAPGEFVYYDTLAHGEQKYRTVKMPDGKVWMTQNLNVVTENSHCLPEVVSNGKKIEFCPFYGRLYNWEEAMKLCPDGWHLPTKEEVHALVNAVGDDSKSGRTLKSKSMLTLGMDMGKGGVKIGWADYTESGLPAGAFVTRKDGGMDVVKSISGAGNDRYGFNALPGGQGALALNSNDYGYAGQGQNGFWWTSSEIDSDSSQIYILDHRSSGVFYKGALKKNNLLSVRCVQGAMPSSASPEAQAPAAAPAVAAGPPVPTVAFAPAEPLKDARNGKTYKTVKIGEQTWMAENLNFKADKSWCYENKEENCDKCGRLGSASCPKGWHLPSCEEWAKLLKAGGAEAFKSKEGWDASSGNGYDIYGFSAQACGTYMPVGDTSFSGFGSTAYFHIGPPKAKNAKNAASEEEDEYAECNHVEMNGANSAGEFRIVHAQELSSMEGALQRSTRCVKD